jgi:hypothetical protein
MIFNDDDDELILMIWFDASFVIDTSSSSSKKRTLCSRLSLSESTITEVTCTIIVDSLSESRLKSVRFLVEKSDADVTSTADRQIIKINYQLNLSSSSSLKIVTYLTDLTSYIVSHKARSSFMSSKKFLELNSSSIKWFVRKLSCLACLAFFAFSSLLGCP